MSNQIIILSGPNGAGKTTCAQRLLQDFLAVYEYVNADWIAEELSEASKSRSEIRSGKIMLKRIKELTNANKSFAFETTLAPRSFLPWLKSLTKNNYELNLYFIWLRTPELAVERVLSRFKIGGHFVPPNTVIRRYYSGINNFFRLYHPLAKNWIVYDNSGLATPECIAYGSYDYSPTVIEPFLWEEFRKGGTNETFQE